MRHSFRWGVPVLDEGNTQIPNIFFRRYARFITCQEWLFVLHLATYKYESEHGECRPSLETIADQMGLHVNTVRGYKQNLVVKGFLRISPNPGRPNTYDFSALAQALMGDTPTSQCTPTSECTPTPQCTTPLHPSVEVPLHPSVGEEEKEEEKEKEKEGAPPALLSDPPKIEPSETTIDFQGIHAERHKTGMAFVLQVYSNAFSLECANCSNTWDWPTTQKGRRSTAARTCPECGAHHIVYTESSAGKHKTYEDASETDMLWEVDTPRAATMVRHLYADTYALEEYLYWWHTDRELVLRKGDWLDGEEWVRGLRPGLTIKRLNAACQSADKKAKPAKQAEKPATPAPPQETSVLGVAAAEDDEQWELPEALRL